MSIAIHNSCWHHDWNASILTLLFSIELDSCSSNLPGLMLAHLCWWISIMNDWWTSWSISHLAMPPCLPKFSTVPLPSDCLIMSNSWIFNSWMENRSFYLRFFIYVRCCRWHSKRILELKWMRLLFDINKRLTAIEKRNVTSKNNW